MRLLLDEHVDPAVAEHLRRLGHDVIAVVDEQDLRGSSDEALLDWATAQDRVIVTYDVRGFMPLLERSTSMGVDCAGLIFVSVRSYPMGDLGHGPLFRDLAKVLQAHPARDALRRRAIWLAA